jgi:hypothetical protein
MTPQPSAQRFGPPNPKSIDLSRPCTPDNQFIIHDPNSPRMIALPSTPSRTTIAVKPSLGNLHSSPPAHQPGSSPLFDQHQFDHGHGHGRQGNKVTDVNNVDDPDDDTSSVLKPGHHVYDGTKSATSSSTAFDSGMLHHTSSESYLIVDPRKDPRLFAKAGKTHAQSLAGTEGNTDAAAGAGAKRKRVDFNKPLKFWLIFVSLCFSCLLSALDLVSRRRPIVLGSPFYFPSYLM